MSQDLRSTIERFNREWRDAGRQRAAIRCLLDRHGRIEQAVWPVVLAAGKGERAKASGLESPKPLAMVHGVPSVARVFQAVKSAATPSRPPIVIVSPETESGVRQTLAAEDAIFVVQPLALGTADAVLCARDRLQDFHGRALVIWGTQPVLRSDTVRQSLVLAALFPDYEMILPTAVMPRPYAPVMRDSEGRVHDAGETNLEQAPAPDFGESNVGLFILWNRTMLAELGALRRAAWRQEQHRYDRPAGELGFPNELIRLLAPRPGGVLASPIADWREEKGIKKQTDIALCEQYIHDVGESLSPVE